MPVQQQEIEFSNLLERHNQTINSICSDTVGVMHSISTNSARSAPWRYGQSSAATAAT